MDKEKEQKHENEIRKVPLLDIRILTDDEWNKLAYRNWLERRCCA